MKRTKKKENAKKDEKERQMLKTRRKRDKTGSMRRTCAAGCTWRDCGWHCCLLFASLIPLLHYFHLFRFRFGTFATLRMNRYVLLAGQSLTEEKRSQNDTRGALNDDTECAC